MKNRITLIILGLITSVLVFSQNYNTNNVTGDWETAANWVTVPPSLTDGNCFSGNYNINGNITRNGDIDVRTNFDVQGTLTVTGTFNTNFLAFVTIEPGDTLFVQGDLNLNAGTMDIRPGGVVIVVGNFNLNLGAIDVFGDLIVLGDFNMDNAAGVIRNDGNLIIVGDFDSGGITTVQILGDPDGSDNVYIVGDSSTVTIDNPGNTDICNNTDPCDVNYGDLGDLNTNEGTGLIDLVNDLVNEHVCNVTLSVIITDVNCQGESTGSIDLTTTGTTTPTITWSNPSWTVDSIQEDISQLIADDYDVLVEEGMCSVNASYTVGFTNSLPGAPTGAATQDFCSGDAPTLADIAITGTGITWYDAATLGNALVSTTSLVDGITYYASQTINACEGTARLAVTTNVNATPGAPTGAATQDFCSGDAPTLADIAITGTGITWYDAATLGNALVSTTSLVDGTTYYASQTINGCEGTARLAVITNVNATPGAPTGAATQDFCSGDAPTLADIAITGTGITWYDAATLGNALVSTTSLVDGITYYASQTINACEGTARLAVITNVNATPGAPTGAATQDFCSGDAPTLADIAITGTGITWYDAATLGNALVSTTSLVDGTTYYASQTINGCEGTARLAVTTNVNATPGAPTGAATQDFCSGDAPTLADIAITGTGITWYDAATLGNALVSTTSLVDGTTYYASQTINACEGTARLAVTTNVNATPGAPTGAATQDFCSGDAPTLADIAITGTGITWYDAATLGNALVSTTSLVDGTTYYASQTINGCEGTARLAVITNVNATPGAPTGAATQDFCSGDAPTLADIAITGTGITWYDAATLGNALVSTTSLVDGTTYYASQTINACEGTARLAVTTNVNATPGAPTGAATQDFCSGDAPTLADIAITGTGITWYDAATLGNALVSTTSLVDGITYYASQTINGCEGTARLAVTTNVNATPGAPTGAATQDFCSGDAPTLADIAITGTGITWYDAATLGNALVSTTSLVDGITYYASQTINGCEGTARLAVITNVNATPGAPTGTSPQDFCAASNPTINDVVVSGTDIIWYDSNVGGSIIAVGTALTDGTTYYASQTIGGCESDSRLAVTTNVGTISAPTGTSPQDFCAASNPTINDVVVSGTDIIWYDSNVGGSIIAVGTALTDGTTYYASQTIGGCESDSRLAVTTNVGTISAPTGTSPQDFCAASNPTINDVVVSGTNITWYDSNVGGSIIAVGTALTDGTTYYASQTIGGCESDSRLAVTTNVGTISAPTGTSPQDFCAASNPTIDDVVVSGTNITWYDSNVGGSIIAVGTALTDGTTYYASQTIGGCESDSRLAVTTNVGTISAPTGTSPQDFCAASNPTIDDVVVSGTNITWYDSNVGGSIIAVGTALTDGTTYYASQTIGGCESDSRLAVTTNVGTISAPTGTSPQDFCAASNPTINDVVVSGTDIIWYDANTGGNVLAPGTLLTDGTTYYANQTIGGCESDSRLAVTTNVGTISAPTGTSPQDFCAASNPTIDDVVVSGTNITWYDANVGGNIIAVGTALTDGTTYYASQTIGGCESDSRLAVTTNVGTISAPTGTSPQDFCAASNPTINDVVVSGTDIIWYDANTGGNVLAPGTLLTDGTTYYASQTIGGCESDSRLAVTTNVGTISAPTGTSPQDFCAASNPTIDDVVVSGTNITWYDSNVGGSIIAVGTALTDGTTYYASQTIGGCESDSRFAVEVTFNANIPGNAGTISGTESVCQGESAITYSVGAINNATEYLWTYTGTGTLINGMSNSITIDFDALATSGELTVQGSNGCGTGPLSESLLIRVNGLPGDAGTIDGVSEICQGQTEVSYEVTPIANADEYVWEFSGTGATLNGDSEIATINFDIDASDGLLSVYGMNTCGQGNSSADFEIVIKSIDECAESELGEISNVFTPNNDGVHETWEIKNIELFPNAKIEVFDRWGRKVFVSENGYNNDWNGTFDGNPLPMDNYFYVIDLLGNGEKVLNGNITIIK